MLRVSEFSETSGVAPDGVEQLVFCDQFVRIAQQVEQDAKCLRFNGEDFAVSYDAELALSNLNISKAENKALTFHHELITPLSGNDQRPIMTVQNHGRRVHPANQAEVIFR